MYILPVKIKKYMLKTSENDNIQEPASKQNLEDILQYKL